MSGVSTWNPHAANVIGLEWFPTSLDHATLDHEDEVLVTKVVSTLSEPIAAIQFFAAAVEDDSTWVTIDVYEDGLPTNVTPATTTTLPNLGGEAIAYGLAMDYPPVTALTTNYVRDSDPTTYHWNYPALHPGMKYYESWGSGATLGTWQDRRILWLRVQGEVDNVWANGYSQPVTFEPMLIGKMSPQKRLRIAAGDWTGVRVWTGWENTVLDARHDTDTATGATSITDSTPDTWGNLDSGHILANFTNNSPWTPHGMLDFLGGPGYDSGSPDRGWNSFGVRLSSAYAAELSARILSLRCEIGYLTTEERAATGTAKIANTGWNVVPVSPPRDFGQPFTKTAGKTYYFVMRLTRDMSKTRKVGSVTVGRLGEAANLPQIRGGFESKREVLGNSHGLVSLLSSETTKCAAMIPSRASGGGYDVSGDGNPYTDLTYVPVLATNSAQQDLTPASNMTIQAVKFMGCLARGKVPASNLVISLRQRGSGTLLAQVQVAEGELAKPRTSGQVITAVFGAPVNLTGGTQYYIHITCPDEGWLAALATIGDNRPDLEVCSFNGPFDRASWGGFSGSSDMPLALYSPPSQVSGFSTVPITTAVEAAAIMQGVEVDWTATSNGATFGYYEIQRWDDDEGLLTIARITDESIQRINDWEVRIGVNAAYRMRVVNTFGIPSSWTGLQVENLTPLECRYYFTSNELPALNVSGIDTSDGKRAWAVTLDSQYVPIYGREGGVQLAELERRGDTFHLDLLLYNTSGSPQRLLPTGKEGRAVFDQFVSLPRARVSYICVRNNQGDRWYASIGAVTPREEQGSLYYVEMDVQQLTWTPSRIDA